MKKSTAIKIITDVFASDVVVWRSQLRLISTANVTQNQKQFTKSYEPRKSSENKINNFNWEPISAKHQNQSNRIQIADSIHAERVWIACTGWHKCKMWARFLAKLVKPCSNHRLYQQNFVDLLVLILNVHKKMVNKICDYLETYHCIETEASLLLASVANRSKNLSIWKQLTKFKNFMKKVNVILLGWLTKIG